MAGSDPTQSHQARELVGQVVRALVAENTLMRDDSARIKRLVSEAAGILRKRFMEIDTAIGNTHCTGDLVESQRAAYRDIVSTLQFEDIVSQVLSHQLERSELCLAMLLQIEEQLHTRHEGSDYQHILGHMAVQVETFLSRLSASDSVKQQSLSVGEAELF